MGVPKSFETTVPATSTHSASGSHDPLGVLWVFPVPAMLATRFDRERLLLGRGDDCDVLLRGAETSRHHAECLRIGSDWVVRDLGSRNGVYVNGQRVEHWTLSGGNVLRLGEWLGIIQPIARSAAIEELLFRQLAPGLYGSARLHAAVAEAERVARSCVRVVVQGETGTGKERVARAIHQWSGRNGNFVGVNCAALPAGLVEGELFGYRKGAFTGADRANLGHFRAAQGGTLLLDEVTEMPLSLQPKLLRVLEERSVTPLGESLAVPIDVRVIAATQEPLQQAVQEKRLRADLCARLTGLTIVLPPLRDRIEDVPGLLAYLLQRHWDGSTPAIHPRLVEQLCLHDWPFNLREIDQLASYLAGAYRHERVLRNSHLPQSMRVAVATQNLLPQRSALEEEAPTNSMSRQVNEKRLQRELELDALRRALRLHHGNMTRAAAALGISRQKAYRIMERAPQEELEELRKLTCPSKLDGGHENPDD